MLLLLALLSAAATPAPDTSALLKLSTFAGFGSGCPVSATRAYTARHVIDPKPFDEGSKLIPGVWSDGVGNMGIFFPNTIARFADVAEIEGEFKKWYEVATEAPKPGDHLWIGGFDWRDKKKMFAERIWEIEVLRVVAGIVVLKENTAPGTSGSCMLTADGKAVAILDFSMQADNATGKTDGLVAGGVGLWYLPKEEPKKEEPKKEEEGK